MTEYTLVVRGKSVGVTVSINNLPLLTLKEGGNISSAKIDHFVIPGQNEVSLRISTPPSRPQLPPDAQATLRILKNGEEQTAYNWSANPENMTLPPIIVQAFEAGEAFGTWEWQSAPPLTLPLADERGLHTLFERLHFALTNRDTGMVLDTLALKNREMARAFGRDPTRAIESQRAFFEDLFSSPDWAMEPLDLQEVKYSLYANGRCVQMLTHNDREPLRTKPDQEGAVFSLPVLASHLATGWTAVR